jgi:hypothetical protein
MTVMTPAQDPVLNCLGADKKHQDKCHDEEYEPMMRAAL